MRLQKKSGLNNEILRVAFIASMGRALNRNFRMGAQLIHQNEWISGHYVYAENLPPLREKTFKERKNLE